MGKLHVTHMFPKVKGKSPLAVKAATSSNDDGNSPLVLWSSRLCPSIHTHRSTEYFGTESCSKAPQLLTGLGPPDRRTTALALDEDPRILIDLTQVRDGPFWDDHSSQSAIVAIFFLGNSSQEREMKIEEPPFERRKIFEILLLLCAETVFPNASAFPPTLKLKPRTGDIASCIVINAD